MFWFIRKSISWTLSLGAFVFFLILVLPGDYRREVSVLIRAPRAKVYSQVRQLSQWNALAMFTDLTRKRVEIPPEVSQYAGRDTNLSDWLAGRPDNAPDDVGDGLSGYLPQLRITEARYPALLVYRVDGGPLPGVEPRVIIEEAESRDWKTVTRVTIREEYRFFGFWAGIKALSARFAAEKLHRRNLNKLRELCEEPAESTADGRQEAGIPLISDESKNGDGATDSAPGGRAVAGRTDFAADIAAEKRRMQKELARLRADLERVREEMNSASAPNRRTGEDHRPLREDARRVIRRN